MILVISGVIRQDKTLSSTRFFFGAVCTWTGFGMRWLFEETMSFVKFVSNHSWMFSFINLKWRVVLLFSTRWPFMRPMSQSATLAWSSDFVGYTSPSTHTLSFVKKRDIVQWRRIIGGLDSI